MSGSKPISLDQFRKRKEKEQQEKKHPGVLVWLFCPTCKTMEYTEIVAPTGRTHKCGTLIEEAEVDLDIRAELTITRFNMEKIDQLLEQNKEFRLVKLFSKSLDKALLALKTSEETYFERLLISSNYQASPYPFDIEEFKDRLPIKDINKLGLLISEFRFEPKKRFGREEKKNSDF